MHWVYISPHFDDVSLSCGGLVWEQVQAGEQVSIWTVCAGKPPPGELSPFAKELHARWGSGKEAIRKRKLEDKKSCQRLGASGRYFSIPDCIYRRHPQSGEFMYTSEDALNGPLHPVDAGTIASLQEEMKQLLSTDMIIVGPMALGNHVDHQLTRLALESLGITAWFYQDYPYVLRSEEQAEILEKGGWVKQIFHVSQQGLVAWHDSIAAHASQISTFWPSENEMRQAITDYFCQYGGVLLWRMSA